MGIYRENCALLFFEIIRDLDAKANKDAWKQSRKKLLRHVGSSMTHNITSVLHLIIMYRLIIQITVHDNYILVIMKCFEIIYHLTFQPLQVYGLLHISRFPIFLHHRRNTRKFIYNYIENNYTVSFKNARMTLINYNIANSRIDVIFEICLLINQGIREFHGSLATRRTCHGPRCPRYGFEQVISAIDRTAGND